MKINISLLTLNKKLNIIIFVEQSLNKSEVIAPPIKS